MFHQPLRLCAVLLLPLLLAGCLLTPGRFTSTLTVNADRSFAFTYQGEVIALDVDKKMKTAKTEAADTAELAAKKAEFDRRARAIAEALTRETGYRKAEYRGDGKFIVDYAIKGVLNHNFVYPFNVDAEAIIPFIAIELRADGKVRVKAPAFGNDKTGPSGMSDLMPPSGGSGPGNTADGTFTLDTDAQIVSQNNEGGATTVGGRKRVTWTVTPLSKAAPMAVLGLK